VLATASALGAALPSYREPEPPGVLGVLEQPQDVLEENLRGVPDRTAAEELDGGVAARV
jgi:hypothetical protein